MRLLLSSIICGALLAGSPGPSALAGVDEPIALRVLYAGNPGSDREAEFVAFLEDHFAEVGTKDYETFTDEDADGFDVVLFDFTSIYPREEDGSVKKDYEKMVYYDRPKLTEDYDRPTMLIGHAGVNAIRSFNLHIDWACLCMKDAAHDLDLEHPIFHTPLDVSPTLEDFTTPEDYKEPNHPRSNELGDSMKVWRVQTRDFPAIDPGLASNTGAFKDAPDAEIISAGVSSIGPFRAGLARHGNFFHWGFAASPADMTPEAQRCFVNAICYIRKFDGKGPIIRNVARKSRDHALASARKLPELLDEDAYRQTLPEAVRDDPEKYAEERSWALYYFRLAYPEEIREDFGDDASKYIAWVEENLEFLRSEGEGPNSMLVVDEAVKALGLSNRSPELLEHCIGMLESEDRPDLARRLLERYTEQSFDDPAGWRRWLDENRDRLHFTERGGYKFVVIPPDYPVPASWREAHGIPEARRTPEPFRPVKASLRLEPAEVDPGGAITAVVRVTTAPRWHIYAMGDAGGPMLPTRLELDLPEGIEAEGDWEGPKPTDSAGGGRVLRGPVEFRRTLRVAEAGPGPLAIRGSIRYQACDPSSCRMPEREDLAAEVTIVDREAPSSR